MYEYLEGRRIILKTIERFSLQNEEEKKEYLDVRNNIFIDCLETCNYDLIVLLLTTYPRNVLLEYKNHCFLLYKTGESLSYSYHNSEIMELYIDFTICLYSNMKYYSYGTTIATNMISIDKYSFTSKSLSVVEHENKYKIIKNKLKMISKFINFILENKLNTEKYFELYMKYNNSYIYILISYF